MMKLLVLLVALIAVAFASHPALIAAPSVVTAQSSQVFSRNYNGLVPFAPAIIAAPHPVAPAFIPHQVVAPYYPSRVVAPFAAAYAPHIHHYNPYAPYARPFLY